MENGFQFIFCSLELFLNRFSVFFFFHGGSYYPEMKLNNIVSGPVTSDRLIPGYLER